MIRRSRRVAAVLVEPIQGEGGVRLTSARFMRKLRLLTRIYDVPLIFDEVQTGWGMTGRLWAHELFDLPCPPDVVTWAKKAQNGVLFVSEELATFFQEEKKFNTTWEGDSVGMIRLLAMIEKLDLDQVRRTGERARARSRGAGSRIPRGPDATCAAPGVMLGFDVMRADLCDALLDRAFRRGLMLLPAGERTVRFYPRYDMEPYAIDEALAILRLAVEDLVGTTVVPEATTSIPGVKTRVGTLAIPIETIEVVELTADDLRGVQAADPRRGTGTLRRARPSTRPTSSWRGDDRCSSSRSATLEATVANPARLASHCATACRDGSWASRSAARSRTTTRKA